MSTTRDNDGVLRRSGGKGTPIKGGGQYAVDPKAAPAGFDLGEAGAELGSVILAGGEEEVDQAIMQLMAEQEVYEDYSSGSYASWAIEFLESDHSFWDRRDRARHIIATAPRLLPANPSWLPAGTIPGGNEMYSRSYGGRSLSATGNKYRSTTEIAKLIREDIKAAVKGGYLPDDLKYSVRKTSEQAIKIEASGMSVQDAYDKREARLSPRTNDGYVLKHSPYYAEVRQRLEHISDQFNWDGSDSMIDYFDVNFYGSESVEVEGAEIPLKEIELSDKLRREQRNGKITPDQARAMWQEQADKNDEILARTTKEMESIARPLGAKFYARVRSEKGRLISVEYSPENDYSPPRPIH